MGSRPGGGGGGGGGVDTAASIFAGESVLGLASMETTESRIDSTVWMGNQRSLADS